MQKREIDRFLANILAGSFVYAPVKKGNGIFVDKISMIKDVDWSGEMPFNSFKRLFAPARELLFQYRHGKIKDVDIAQNQIVAWAMNILDLQAFTLIDHVFEKDAYYQKRKQNLLVIGFTNGLPEDFRKYKAFHQDYEENVLEHILFDIFIERQKSGNFILFSGSAKGQKVLEENGISEYEHIEFAGLVQEKGVDQRLLDNRKAVEMNPAHPLWNELADKCLACGKCSLYCPTCFCFEEFDEPELDHVNKVRTGSPCFYSEFSKVAGGHKELDSTQKKLYFWYYHKFVRIPDELSYFGCVSCMRCFKVCPVEINVMQNLQKLKSKGK